MDSGVLFKEILKENELGANHVSLSYSQDHTKLYVTHPPDGPYNVIKYYNKTDEGWSNPQIIDVFQNNCEYIWGVYPIGNHGLLIQASYLKAKKGMKMVSSMLRDYPTMNGQHHR